jgi:hypothetical protein
MSNLIKVPHTLTFEATIDLDKIPAKLLPALLGLSETALLQMCTEATVNAIGESKFLQIANENNTWAEVTIKEGN